MRILLAIVSFLLAAVLLGYFGLCIFAAISEAGLVLAVQEIMDGWQNIAILSGCLLFAAVLVITGIAVLGSRPESAR